MTTELLSERVTFTEQPLTAELIDAALPLLEAHYREIAHYPDIPLVIDRAMYLQAAAQGMVRVFLFFDGPDLQGYAVFFVKTNMHYATSRQATQDILYLAPKYRGQLLGARFIDWCDAQLRKAGVQVVYQHVKTAHDFGPTLDRLGYERVEAIWARRLDRDERN
jgi:GNAT superfamily N-acetyltransferase